MKVTKCCNQYFYPQYDIDGETILEFYCGSCDKTINVNKDLKEMEE